MPSPSGTLTPSGTAPPWLAQFAATIDLTLPPAVGPGCPGDE